VAIKLLNQNLINTEADQINVLREVSLFRRMNHPLITKFFFVTHEKENIAIVQEYVQHGTLLNLLESQGPLPENQLRYYFLQLVWVLDYLHNVQNVAHHDLTLENIILDAHNNIKFIDFGFSRAFIQSQNQFTTFCSSPPYIAPELITTGKYTYAADIWSLGIMLYALAIGKFPFFHNNLPTLHRQIISGQIHYPITLSDDFIDLLQRMLCCDPSNGVTIEQIKARPWFVAQ
jgi:serine/threonine protein kinase